MDILFCDIDGVLQQSSFSLDPHKKWSEEERKAYIAAMVDNQPAIVLLSLLKGWRIYLATGRKKSDFGEITRLLATKIGISSPQVFYYPEGLPFSLEAYFQHKLDCILKIDKEFHYSRADHTIHIIDDDHQLCEFVKSKSDLIHSKISIHEVSLKHPSYI